MVGIVDRKARLFSRIVQLRRAERAHPTNADIAAVRADLERELGAVVSRSLAARLLDIHHSSLQRWIDSKDLPLVMDERGRVGVPVGALIELYERVLQDRRTGETRQHVLEPGLVNGRRQADKLRPKTLVVDELGSGEDIDPHDRAALRSLAYHRALARRLRRSMVDQARRQLWRWREEGTIDDHYANAWEEILDRPVSEVRRAISENTREASDLRQSSPFAGMLSEPERQKILQEIR